MAGRVGHTGGLINPRPWRGRCRAGYSIIPVGLPCLERERLVKKRLRKEGRTGLDIAQQNAYLQDSKLSGIRSTETFYRQFPDRNFW